jgi:hypothetical protein
MNLAAFLRAQARADRARAEELERAAAELEGRNEGMIDVKDTPLGVRRGAARVRARLNRGAPGAAIVGRKFFLSPEALDEELSRPSKAREQGSNDSAAARAARRLSRVA